ncbi:YjbF family lipoprotein [uncultured Tateyamaria sp.]|uniref:YjbF family lipoprotein n=1 Tax=uncultured Tateyamaria sp. TaxID=455651 RepID=UPI00262FB0A7|nr:YjbF family lipoprotein [uncultured Tateyamaria sp.]
MIRAVWMTVLAAVFGVAACTDGRDADFSRSTESPSIVDRLSGRHAKPETPPALTPELIAGLTSPALEVTLERSGTRAILSPYSDRPDHGQGIVRVWRSSDDSQIVLRDGVLISTRGLGNDLGSTQAQNMLAAIRARAPKPFRHELYVVTGVNGTQRIDLACEMRMVGVEQIEIAKQLIDTARLRANCRHGAELITYDFWVDPGGTTIWQSRQWAGPSLGYIHTRLLKS